MKILLVLAIILSGLLLPLTTHAQAGTSTCKAGANGFVDWQKCLAGTKDGGGGGTIDPVFINNAYDKFYKDALYVCTSSAISPIVTKNCEAAAAAAVLNKFALDIFAIILAVMFFIFSFLIFISRIKYITAGDNEEQVKTAKKTATAAFVGFLFIFIGLIVGEILAISIGTNLWEVKLFGIV